MTASPGGTSRDVEMCQGAASEVPDRENDTQNDTQPGCQRSISGQNRTHVRPERGAITCPRMRRKSPPGTTKGLLSALFGGGRQAR